MEDLFDSPPAPGHERARPVEENYWTLKLTPLMAAPGKWARLCAYKDRSTANQAAHRLRQRKITGVPDGRWDFRGIKGELWASYIGPTNKKGRT